MDLLDRLLGHDEWTTGECLRRCRELSPEQMRRRHDMGWGSVQATLLHMISNVQVWTELMRDGDSPTARTDDPILDIDGLERLHRSSYEAFAAFARRVRDEGRWDETWVDVLDDPPREKSYGGAVLHVITHDMHHRSEVLHMLQRLGLADLPEGDLLGWEATVSAEHEVATR